MGSGELKSKVKRTDYFIRHLVRHLVRHNTEWSVKEEARSAKAKALAKDGLTIFRIVYGKGCFQLARGGSGSPEKEGYAWN